MWAFVAGADRIRPTLGGFSWVLNYEKMLGGPELPRGNHLLQATQGLESSMHPMKKDKLEAIERVIRGSAVKARDHVFRSKRGPELGRVRAKSWEDWERCSRGSAWFVAWCSDAPIVVFRQRLARNSLYDSGRLRSRASD